jgi:hypothetical protein
MGTKRMIDDQPQGVWRYHLGRTLSHRSSKHVPIQYISIDITTLLAHHDIMIHIICSYGGSHSVKKYRVH